MLVHLEDVGRELARPIDGPVLSSPGPGLHLACLKLELWRDESSSPFLRAEIRGVRADVMVYDDASGSLDFQVGGWGAVELWGVSQPPPPPSGLLWFSVPLLGMDGQRE